MVDAIAAFKEAFSSYMKNLKGYLLYSLIVSAISFLMAFVLAVLTATIGVLAIGGVYQAITSGTFSIGTAAIIFTLLITALSFFLFAWVAAGLHGAYIDTINGFLSGRKQTVGNLLSSVPRFATPVFLTAFIISAIVGVPLVLLFFAATLMDNEAAKYGLLFVALIIASFMAFFFAFAVPAVVIDRKSPLQAVSSSVSKAVRNIFPLAVFFICTIPLSLGNIIPPVNFIYAPLFYMPFTLATLIVIYRRAK